MMLKKAHTLFITDRFLSFQFFPFLIQYDFCLIHGLSQHTGKKLLRNRRGIVKALLINASEFFQNI